MLIHTRAARLAAACCGVLALAACGTARPASSTPSPTTTSSPHTASGTTLPVGQAAVVPWQDEPGDPAGTLEVSVTEVSDGTVAGLAVPDPDAPSSFNDVTFLVRVKVTNVGQVPVHPGGIFGVATVYDTNGDPMTPAHFGAPDENCTSSSSPDAPLAADEDLTDCKPYLGNVLAPHIGKIVMDGFAPDGPAITWTTG